MEATNSLGTVEATVTVTVEPTKEPEEEEPVNEAVCVEETTTQETVAEHDDKEEESTEISVVPEIMIKPEDITVTPGESVKLSCKIKGILLIHSFEKFVWKYQCVLYIIRFCILNSVSPLVVFPYVYAKYNLFSLFYFYFVVIHFVHVIFRGMVNFLFVYANYNAFSLRILTWLQLILLRLFFTVAYASC